MGGETVCWKCGSSLKPRPEKSEPAPEATERTLIHFEGTAAPDPATRTATTLTGEVVEVPTSPAQEPTQLIAATIGEAQIEAPTEQVMYLTFCKVCGLQNEEGAMECRKCKTPLEVVALGSVPEVEPLPRNWSFDVLGVVWIVLGLAAIYCGWFLVKADPSHPGATWSDYFWTGAVACAPGILIFLRHPFCRLMFWTMTLVSVLVWLVLGIVWILGHLQVSDNGQIGLSWLAVLSGLAIFSFFIVRQNDAFDTAAPHFPYS